MRPIIVCLGVALASSAAAAQAPASLSPQVQALQQTVLELTGQKIDWQARAIELQAKVDALEKQIAAKPTEPKEPKP
jgi:hypothetical protein